MNYSHYLSTFEALELEAFDKYCDDDILEALESEAQSAELSGLMVCGDDEWGRR